MSERPAGGERRRGSLTVVGTGIDAVSQLTPAARGAIEGADEVFYLLADPVAARRIEALKPTATSLDHLYGPTKERRETYAELAETIAAAALRGARVCVVFYGHPGVFARSGHEAVERVRAAGLPARMLPAVSALDCLIADLGLDPARSGLQTYEATYFFLRRPPVDPHAILVLLQVGMLGERAVPRPSRWRLVSGSSSITWSSSTARSARQSSTRRLRIRARLLPSTGSRSETAGPGRPR